MRDLHRIIFQGVNGWSLKSFLQISIRIREFIPDCKIGVYLTGEPPPPTTDDPQVIYAHQKAMEWSDRQLKVGKCEVFNRPAAAEDFAEAAVWSYPTHIPQTSTMEAAQLAQKHGAIPVFNPIGILVDQVFAGVPICGIPALDPLVRMRYAYETIRLLSEPALQESIRVPMMEYAASKEYAILCDASQIEGWMTRPELEWLISRASEMGSVAEIGCWKGRSTTAISSACRGTVYAIDHWNGGKDEPEHIRKAAAEDKVYSDFIKNMERRWNVVPIRKPSLEAAARIELVDMTFIDAGHGFDDVVADIRAWLPKTRRLICGHDYSFTDVQKAVTQELGTVELGVGDIWWKWLNQENMANAAD